MPIIFDGYVAASQQEAALKQQVADLTQHGVKLCIASVLFTEDQGSVMYTQLKHEAAARIGIEYRVKKFSLRANLTEVIEYLHQLNSDSTVTGIIIQKPWRQTWQDVAVADRPEATPQDFQSWWRSLTQEIQPDKDVDGLHPETLAAIQASTWQVQGKVLPATCRAVVSILFQAYQQLQITEAVWHNYKIVILGKSDLLGQPLFFYLKNQGINVEIIGSAELADRIQQGVALSDADVIVSATGRAKLITGEMVKPGVIVIDVGEPRGDVDFESVSAKAAFITPVPGGVGPMTVVSLMENCLEIEDHSSSTARIG